VLQAELHSLPEDAPAVSQQLQAELPVFPRQVEASPRLPAPVFGPAE
jgi:hypothetical protein